jgi:hypothetical protein
MRARLTAMGHHWRALRESNPFFSRERDAIGGVHGVHHHLKNAD